MQIEVRNVLGTARANFTVNPTDLALVCGLNASGKTSLLEAIGAALTADPKFRGVTAKKDFEDLVRQGRKEGHVKISGPDGSVKLTLPSGEVESEGQPPAADIFSCHIGMIGALTPANRQSLLTERLNAMPTREDLEKHLDKAIKESVVEHVDDALFEAIVAKLWTTIDEEGWDGATKAVETRGTKLRGAWEHITGERYGKRKALGWIHPDFDFDERKDYAAAVTDAEAALEAAVGQQAVSDEHIASLRQKIKAGEDADARIPEMQKVSDEAARYLQAHAKKLEAAPKPPDQAGVWDCPHCGATIQEEREGNHIRRMVKASTESLTDSEIQQRRNDLIPLEAEVKRAKRSLETAEGELKVARLTVSKGIDAQAEYNDAKDQEGGGDPAAVERARNKLEKARTELAHHKSMVDAGAQSRAYALNQVLRHAVDPDGVRGERLASHLEKFNLILAKQSALFGCADVQIADDFEVNIGGRRYQLMSESEQLRADVVTMVALAQSSNPAMLLVDRLDLIDGNDRIGVLKVLRETGIPSVIAMTTTAVDKCPDLASNDWGNVLWMNAGTLEETDR